MWIPGAREALKILNDNGIDVFVITNQAGVGGGVMSIESLHFIHRMMCREVELWGGRITKVYYCPHARSEGCSCRKPKPGLLLDAMREFHIQFDTALFLGDSITDGEAAMAVNCEFMKVSKSDTLFEIVRRIFD